MQSTNNASLGETVRRGTDLETLAHLELSYRLGRKVTLADVARAAQELPDVPEELRGPLGAICDQEVEAQFPYGCQVVEVGNAAEHQEAFTSFAGGADFTLLIDGN